MAMISVMIVDLYWLWLTLSFTITFLACVLFFGIGEPKPPQGFRAVVVIAFLAAFSISVITAALVLASWAVIQIATFFGYGAISEPMCLLLVLLLYPALVGKYVMPIVRSKEQKRETMMPLDRFKHAALFTLAFLSLFSPLTIYIYCYKDMIPIESWFAAILFILFIVGVGAVARLFDIWR